jgi:hypothetical protein
MLRCDIPANAMMKFACDTLSPACGESGTIKIASRSGWHSKRNDCTAPFPARFPFVNLVPHSPAGYTPAMSPGGSSGRRHSSADLAPVRSRSNVERSDGVEIQRNRPLIRAQAWTSTTERVSVQVSGQNDDCADWNALFSLLAQMPCEATRSARSQEQGIRSSFFEVTLTRQGTKHEWPGAIDPYAAQSPTRRKL